MIDESYNIIIFKIEKTQAIYTLVHVNDNSAWCYDYHD